MIFYCILFNLKKKYEKKCSFKIKLRRIKKLKMFLSYENDFPYSSHDFVDSYSIKSPITPQLLFKKGEMVTKSNFKSQYLSIQNSSCCEYTPQMHNYEQFCDNCCFIDLTKKRKSHLLPKITKSPKPFLSPRNKEHRPKTYYFSDPNSPLAFQFIKNLESMNIMLLHQLLLLVKKKNLSMKKEIKLRNLGEYKAYQELKKLGSHIYLKKALVNKMKSILQQMKI